MNGISDRGSIPLSSIALKCWKYSILGLLLYKNVVKQYREKFYRMEINMIHGLVTWAVIRKTQTDPPDMLIGNTEMTACIAMVCKDAGEDVPDFETPEELYEKFFNIIEEIDISGLSETSVKMIDMLKQYHVLPMKNETIEDLKKIVEIC